MSELLERPQATSAANALGGGEAASVQACLNYVAPQAAFQFAHILDESQSTLNLRPETVRIGNARRLCPAASLDAEGFAVFDRPTAFTDFLDLGRLHEQYAAEVIGIVSEITGAARVVGTPPAVRITDAAERQRQQQIPDAARHVHLDFSDASLREQLVRFMGLSPVELDRYSRVCVYNTWRSITPPPQDKPLALCDLRSISPDDVHIVHGYYPIAEVGYFEIAVLDHSPRHQWWYFPDLETRELVVFRGGQLGSDAAGVFHSAFDDPACGQEVAGRWSVEMRTVALFD
jgi:hypothetical protein